MSSLPGILVVDRRASILIVDAQQYAPGSVGRIMLLGQFTACSEIYNALPTLVAKAHAFGKFESSDTYFILFNHHNIDQTSPDPEKFLQRLVELHQTTTSENGMFGFPVSTCDGAVPLNLTWQKDWASFYTQVLRGLLDLDNEANGNWIQLDEIFDRMASDVIPRLLGALYLDGRELRPCLIHGDMWEGNFGKDTDTGEIIFVDASSYYAHNELELGLWRWAPLMSTMIKRYLELNPPSEPAEEWDDRNRLYSLKSKLNMSVDHPGEDGRATRKV
jgi:protein-ribulosamine 3-kinase